jgi:FdhD protein
MIEPAVIIPVRASDYTAHSVDGYRTIPVEAAIAIEINGIAYAVMMATPCDLDDFVTGFLLSEGLASSDEIGAVSTHPLENGEGFVARVNLPPDRLAPILDRARRRLGDSSCGICGIESVEMALRPLPKLEIRSTVRADAIRRGLSEMRGAQSLGKQTAATHAAAFCTRDGAVVMLREDVGRHNALDKVIGALARTAMDPADGFLIVTSRCSYELVEKTVRAGCPLLVAISAPTDLAVRRAEAAGLQLAAIARDDSMLWVTNPSMEAHHGL